MLEVLARRHYREYDLHDLRVDRGLDGARYGGRPFVVAEYTLDDRRTRLVSTIGTYADLADPEGDLATAIGAQVTGREAGHEAVVDLYLHWPEAPEDAEEVSRVLRPLVAAQPYVQEVRRFSVAVCAGAERPVGYYAFRPDGAGGAVEDTLTRGVHPMVGRRLNLWRLREFDVTRIEAPEDVLLYECVATREPRRPAAGGPGPGATAGGRARRAGPGHRSPARRACRGELPGGDPPGPRRARCRRQQARHEPRLGAGLASGRDRRRRAGRARQQDPAAHRRRGHRGGARPRARPRSGRHTGPGVRAVRREAGSRRGDLRRGAADRGAQAARRLRGEGSPGPPPRAGLPLRARPGARRHRWHPRRARPGRHGCARAGRPTAGAELRRHHRRPRHHADAAPPGGGHPRRAVRRPDQVAGFGRRGRVPADHRRARPRRADAGAGRVVRPVGRCPDLDGLRHREHGLGGRRAPPDRGVHPGRRRDQRRRGGHQRRGAALLERRGDHAHAHQGHLGDDAGQRDGPDRQAVPRLLRWCVR